MLNLGVVKTGTTIPIPFGSYGNDGESITMSGFGLADIKIYKNGSTTVRNTTAGYTLLDTDGIDFASITGIHGFSVDLSDNTDAGFFAAGNWYWVIVDNVTINAQTVSFVAAVFYLAAQSIDDIPTTPMRGTDNANTVVPDAAGVAPTKEEIRTEIDVNSTQFPIVISAVDDIAGAVAGIEGGGSSPGDNTINN